MTPEVERALEEHISKAEQKRRDREKAKEELRKTFPPGAKVYTLVNYVSRSGMVRSIKVFAHQPDGIEDVSWQVARALDWRLHAHNGVKVDGAGMDMTFHLVYSLSATLYPNGFTCLGESDGAMYGTRCPSNDHSNDRGVRNYSKTRHHNDGGYALRNRNL